MGCMKPFPVWQSATSVPNSYWSTSGFILGVRPRTMDRSEISNGPLALPLLGAREEHYVLEMKPHSYSLIVV